jgi:hypothetical protein
MMGETPRAGFGRRGGDTLERRVIGLEEQVERIEGGLKIAQANVDALIRSSQPGVIRKFLMRGSVLTVLGTALIASLSWGWREAALYDTRNTQVEALVGAMPVLVTNLERLASGLDGVCNLLVRIRPASGPEAPHCERIPIAPLFLKPAVDP